MYVSRKFTDRDIRDNPVLVGVAEDYLRSYTGDFDFLVACGNVLHNNGSLPAPLARAVLNCMRQDPFAQDKLPKLTQPDRPRKPYTIPAFADFDTRRTRITLRSKFKHDYVLSQAKNATVAHMIRHGAGGVIYYPYVGKFSIDVRLWCGKTLSKSVKHTNDPEDRKICVACWTNKHTFGALDAIADEQASTEQ